MMERREGASAYKVILQKDQKQFGCNFHVETEFLWHTASAVGSEAVSKVC